MSREIRKVPADWQHPGEAFLRHEFRGDYNVWDLRWKPLYGDDMSAMISGRECTHWQMYETTSEGTPISPVMATPEELARWLADNHISVFGSQTATYDQWLATIRGSGAVVGAVMHGDGRITPGWLDSQDDRR